MELIPVGTQVKIRYESPHFFQNFTGGKTIGTPLKGIVISNEYKSARDRRYIYYVEWFLRGKPYDKNSYRPEDLEVVQNSNTVRKMNQEGAL